MQQEKIDTISRISPLDIWTVCRHHWKTKVPMNLIGEPSTVKSEAIYQFAKEQAGKEEREFFDWNKSSEERKKEVAENPAKFFIFADVRASETDIGELRLQDMAKEEKFITFKYNVLFHALSKATAVGILFLDEMSNANNMIKQQFYKIINDRAIGDIPLADGVLVCSAGNQAEHSRAVTEDPVPLVLRRANYFVRPLTDEEFIAYAVKENFHPWVIGYLGFQPNDVHNIQYDLPESVGQPCPRTWKLFNGILALGGDSMSIREVEMTATGHIGQGVGKKFTAYVKAAKSINLNEILAKPEMIKQFESNEVEISLVYAIISGVIDKFRTDNKVIKPAFEMALYFQRPEFGAFMLRGLKQIDEKAFRKAGIDEKILPKEVVDKVLEKYAKYLFKDVS